MSTIPPDDDLTPIPPSQPPAGAAQPEVPVYDRKEPKTLKVGPVIGIAVLALVLGAVGGFFIGNSSGGSSGPKTLADALSQFRAGKLPAGNGAGGGFAGGGAPGGAGGGGTTGTGGGGTGGTGGGAGGGGFGRGLIGTVSSVDGDTVTVTTQAGNVKVTVTPSTTFTKSAPGAISDLTKGTNVRVTAAGSSSGNSSGSSVTANSIAEVPAGAGGPGRGAAAGGGGSGN